MERYITDEHGVRKAVILDIEDYKALVQAAEDADDIRAVNEVRRQLAAGEDEMIDYRELPQWELSASDASRRSTSSSSVSNGRLT